MPKNKGKGDPNAPAWAIKGFLQKTYPHNIRERILQGAGEDDVHIFRAAEDAEQENVQSPLPIVCHPTLMEVTDCGRDIFSELDELKKEHDILRQTKVLVDCIECIHRVAHMLNQKVLKMFGKVLQNVNEAEKEFLRNGPFSNLKDGKRLCGTYAELLQYYDKKPSDKLDKYLRKVEMKGVKLLKRVDVLPHGTNDLRMKFRNFLANGKGLRDVQSHVGMVKDHHTREAILQRVEAYGKSTLDVYGLADLFPMVVAGVYVLRNGEIEDDAENDEGAECKVFNLGAEPEAAMSLPIVSTVKATFLVTKKLPLLDVVGLFGNIQRLGNSDPEKALRMTCKDGIMWERIVELPRDVDLVYSYVVLRKVIGQKKWLLVEGPMDPLEVHVGATSTIMLSTEWDVGCIMTGLFDSV